MPATTVETEILELEKRYWDAMKAGDADAVQSLTADPCLVVGSQGANLIDAKQFRQMFESDDWKITSYELDERNAAIRPINNDTAVISYHVKEGVKMQGKPQTIEAYDTSVWAREGGKWRCVAHTESFAMPAR